MRTRAQVRARTRPQARYLLPLSTHCVPVPSADTQRSKPTAPQRFSAGHGPVWTRKLDTPGRPPHRGGEPGPTTSV